MGQVILTSCQEQHRPTGIGKLTVRYLHPTVDGRQDIAFHVGDLGLANLDFGLFRCRSSQGYA